MLYGTIVSKGIAIGSAFVLSSGKKEESVSHVSMHDTEYSTQKYLIAKEQTRQSLESLVSVIEESNKDIADMMRGQIAILEDVGLNESIYSLIGGYHFTCEYAIEIAYNQWIKRFSDLSDPMTKERYADVQDVKNRLLSFLLSTGRGKIELPKTPSVLVADTLLPSDIATLGREMILGIVSESGNANSHFALIAKELGIPALTGVNRALVQIETGMTVIVDALTGLVIENPSNEELGAYRENRDAYQVAVSEMKNFVSLAAVSKDSKPYRVYLNLSSLTKEAVSLSPYSSGVGLFRSEFQFADYEVPPTEDEQYEIYRDLTKAFGEHECVIRTFDFQEDKLPKFMNPGSSENKDEAPYFLDEQETVTPKKAAGVENKEFTESIIYTQIRAILRAAVHGNLGIMFPMVRSIDELRSNKALIEKAKIELRTEKIAFRESLPFGVMIETPSLALLSDVVARETNFASIGTNDLSRFLSGAGDRLNAQNQNFDYRPDLYRLIKSIIDAFAVFRKPLSVCGELAGNPITAPLLAGLGIERFSVDPLAISTIKEALSKFTVQETKDMAERVLGLATCAETENYLKMKAV
ncbi:MAG: phosphoenolpyruvate--protein phosphotransferase [Lachnospiraceae bacterium]|nr:phosphoenolpyruvate--protein phosphotransferase [Lachnospiraceae bacterium]